MPSLNVTGITKLQARGFSLQELSFSMEPLERLVIAGATGSGKTTLLKIIAGLMQADGGTVMFGSERVRGPEERLMPGHPGIVYLSQHFELRKNYRVADELSAVNRLNEEEARRVYGICRIGHLLGRMTDAVSGGERQRIALAKALVRDPQLLLLDEPYSNLDAAHKQTMQKVVEELGPGLGVSCLKVLHDATDILSWADRLIVMKEGRIVQSGSPREVYLDPVDEYVAGILGPYHLIREEHLLQRIPGQGGKPGAVMVRPGSMRLVSPGKGIWQGKVEGIRFMGTYHLLHVRSGDTLLTVHVPNEAYAVGDEVDIDFNPKDIRHIGTE